MTRHSTPGRRGACCAPLASLAAVACGLAACTGAVPSPTAVDARRTGSTVAELDEGRSVFVRKCSGCHALIPPAELSASEWKAKLGVMAERAKLDAPSRRRLSRYLLAFAARRGAPGAPSAAATTRR